MDCYPNQALQQNEGNVPAVKNKRGPCSTRKDCSVGYTCFDGECEKSTWVASAGNHAFGSTVFIYGAGTVYSSAISIFSSFANYRSGDYYDSYYGKEDALLMLGPQSGAFVVFGGLNQISKGKQALYLRKLGAKPASKLVGTGVLLYGLSLVTMGVHLVSYASDEPGFVRTTAFVNAAVLASSFVVNVAGYYKQAQLLQGATGVPLNRMVETSPPRVAPYAGIIRGGGAAGAVVYF